MGSNEAVSEKTIPSAIRSSSCSCSCLRRSRASSAPSRLPATGPSRPLAGEALSDGHGEGHVSGKTGFAVNRVLLDRADVRATRRILQRSYYLAALQVLPAAPPLGALRRQADKTVDEMPDGGRQRKRTRKSFCARSILSRRSGRGSALTPPGIRSKQQNCLTRTIFPCVLGFRSARRAVRTARS